MNADVEITATADGAWAAHLALLPTPFAAVRKTLAAFARGHNFPVTAALLGDPVTVVTLLRDPSATYGAPSIEECKLAVAELAYATGWHHTYVVRPPSGLTVPIGLREGYDINAPVHAVHEVASLLPVSGWTLSPSRHFSARPVDDGEPYDEPAVVLQFDEDQTDVVVQLAHALRQDRVAVTNWGTDRTTALRITIPEGQTR